MAFTAAKCSLYVCTGLVLVIFHTYSLLSLPPEAKCWWSGDHLSPHTSCRWPVSLRSGRTHGVRMSLCRINLSRLPDDKISVFQARAPVLTNKIWFFSFTNIYNCKLLLLFEIYPLKWDYSQKIEKCCFCEHLAPTNSGTVALQCVQFLSCCYIPYLNISFVGSYSYQMSLYQDRVNYITCVYYFNNVGKWTKYLQNTLWLQNWNKI